MTASIMTEAQMDRACETAAAIGAAIRTARRAAGESIDVAAKACVTSRQTLQLIEVGGSPRMTLGTVQKFLDRYGLRLVVTSACVDSITCTCGATIASACICTITERALQCADSRSDS